MLTGRAKSAIALSGVGLDDSGNDVALDELALAACGLSESTGGETIEVAHGAGSGLVEQDDSVGGEYLAGTARARQSHAEVLAAVVWGQRTDLEAVVEARVERAIASERQALAELGEPDEDERQERAAVPCVVEQDVQVVERVLVQEVSFVEEKHRMDALCGVVFDVPGERVEEAAGGRRGREPDGVAGVTR